MGFDIEVVDADGMAWFLGWGLGVEEEDEGLRGWYHAHELSGYIGMKQWQANTR